MKILITGKNSYIGNSVKAWLENKEVGYTIDTISLKDRNLDEISFKSYDVIFHVAGIAHISHKKSLISKYFTVNRDLAIAVAKKAQEEENAKKLAETAKQPPVEEEKKEELAS